MKRLELTTFGGVDIKLNGQPINILSARKTQALLVYLGVTKQKQSRQVLAGLLWGEMPEAKARRNLRVALTRIRDLLEPYLIIKRRSLAINLESNLWVDVIEFESCLAGPNPTIPQLERATALYQGTFLNDFYLRDAPSFEEWVRPLQERYRQMAMKAIYSLVLHHRKHHQYDSAIQYTNRLLDLEPWMEEAYRQLMYLFAIQGQRTAALAQYELCQNLLWEELGVEPSPETETLYEQIRDGKLVSDPDPPPLSVAVANSVKPVQIPASTDHFVGRSAIIKSIVADLHADQGPTVHALIGMGGVGKSTLAIQVARAVQEEFTDGILWANAASSEPMAVMESWAAAYGYDFTRIADVESMAAAFRGILSDKKVLLVFDNVDSVSRIRPLLPGGNQCRVLITTRDQDLAQALNAKIWLVNELSPENGRLLLSSILGEARVSTEPVAAETICSLLQNLPLAVEITAQRLKSRPRRRLKDMAQRLRDETQRLSLLKISDREVRASFAISWEALDTERRRVFALIGLFNGRNFTSEAMAYITEMKRFPLEDRLFDLINLSLLRAEGERLYHQHPLLADFAREKLGDNLAVGNGRFATYYLQFSQQNQRDYDALSPEWENLTAALETAYEYKQWDITTGYAEALTDAWFARGRYAQASRGFELASEAAENLNNQNLLADYLYKWARALVEQSLYDEARRLLLRNLDLFTSLNNQAGLANVNFELARIALAQSNYTEAQQYLIKSREIRELIGDKAGIAETITGQARIFYNKGEYQKAYDLSQEAVILYEETDYKQGLILSLRTLVNSILELHKHRFSQLDGLESAKNYCERALQLAEELQDRGEQAATLYTLSSVHLLQNSFEEAEEVGKQSLKLLERIGDQRSQGVVLSLLGDIYYAQEKYENALEAAYLSLDLFQKLGILTNIAVAKANLGLFHKCLNHHKRAKKYWQEALELAEELGHLTLVGRIQKRLQEE